MIGSRQVDGFEALTLTSGDGEIEAAFVPGAGMVGCSLRHRGDELLGQRGGLARYAEDRSTMGIPLLHPWANRLAQSRFEIAGREVDLDKASPPPNVDPHGLPIHGLLAAAEGWQVEQHGSSDDGGHLLSGFDFGARPDLIAAFPFPHELTIEATLSGAAPPSRPSSSHRATSRCRSRSATTLTFACPCRESRMADRDTGQRAPRTGCRRAADGFAEAAHAEDGPLGSRAPTTSSSPRRTRRRWCSRTAPGASRRPCSPGTPTRRLMRRGTTTWSRSSR